MLTEEEKTQDTIRHGRTRQVWSEWIGTRSKGRYTERVGNEANESWTKLKLGKKVRGAGGWRRWNETGRSVEINR